MNKRFTFILIISIICMCVIVAVFCFLQKKPQRIYKFETISQKIDVNCNDMIYGSDTAQLKIIMFATYNCRHCRNFLKLDFPHIKKEYIDSGKIQMIIKPIEISENPDMLSALQLLLCMNSSGNADDINELLLTQPSAIYSDDFRELIDDIINGNPDLAECLMSDNFFTIKQNNNDYKALKTNLTPIFVIGNHFYVGRKKLAKFTQVIDYEMENINN